MKHRSKYLRFGVFLACVLMTTSALFGQSWIQIESVNIKGQKWTRQYVISRELDFQQGDTILLENLIERLSVNRDRLLNTGLFNQVELNVVKWDIDEKKAEIDVDLVENWFWYPSPIFELADRSINEWWYQHNASFDRLNLGIRFMHINLTGNADKLKLNLHGGFTRKYEIDYTFPYLNRAQTLGAYFNVMYVTHKEIAFETRNNKLNFIGHENDILLTRFRTSMGINYRKNKEYYQSFIAEYNQKMVHDTISQGLNPNFFNEGENILRHIRLNYIFKYTDVDKRIYPTYGSRFLFYARKDGGIFFDDLNYLHLTTAYEKILKWNDIFSTSARFKLKKAINFGQKVPYAYLNGMGFFDDVLSGYQLYVIDGQDYAYVKSTQKIKLLDLEYDMGALMPLRQFRVFPLQVFLGLHGDIGYVHEEQFADINPFNNRALYGAAISLDLLVYHNYFISWEFTVNHLGELGFFLQGTNTFM